MTMRVVLFLLLFLPSLVFGAELVNINTADSALLDTLYGIGPSKAAAIIEYRALNGPFAVIEDIQNVSGIGPVTFEGIKDSITVRGGISTLPPREKKPTPPSTRSTVVQKVEPVISPSSQLAHVEDAAVAPAAVTTVPAAGAPHFSFYEILTSPWTFGFVGAVVLAVAVILFL
jgi:competence protein ComEA